MPDLGGSDEEEEDGCLISLEDLVVSDHPCLASKELSIFHRRDVQCVTEPQTDWRYCQSKGHLACMHDACM